MKLFDRRYRVRVDRLELDAFDVSFDVEKSVKREPNKCNLRIYNLSAEHRRSIESLSVLPRRIGTAPKGQGRIRVEIEAGYVDGMSLIFRGDLRTAITRREGSDLITTLEGEDGGRAFLWGRINRSYPPGTPATTVLRDCAAAMGVGLGNLPEISAAAAFTGGGTVFSQGTVVSGAAHNELDRLLRSMGLRWSVQNGVLSVTRQGRALDSFPVVLGSATGLIGRPESNVDGTITARSLIIPDVTPGRRVVFDPTLGLSGAYRIDRAKYTGDTTAQPWYIDMTLRPAA